MIKRPEKPNMYSYRKVEVFLADLLSWYKTQGQSMRNLATKLNISVSLLSLMAKGKRSFTEENVDVFAPFFSWNAQEVSWLKQLILLNDPDIDKKHSAMKSLSRFNDFKDESAKEVLTYKYLKKWWNIAIREMSELPDFKDDAYWIQERLLFQVPLVEIRKSLSFLHKHKLLASYGAFRRLDCQAEIYKLSLSAFHTQMLEKAVESIHKVSSDDRYILGHTMALDKEKFDEAKVILSEALEKISALSESSKKMENVYHFSFVGFPLTSSKDKK